MEMLIWYFRNWNHKDNFKDSYIHDQKECYLTQSIVSIDVKDTMKCEKH